MANPYDVVAVGGGPAGLAAALVLGRARRRVLLCDAGPRRNAAATHVHGFVTRDGTPPAEFRQIAREQLATYRSVKSRDVQVEAITGERGAFRVQLADGVVGARRILLCTGMVDQPLELEGFRKLWGRSIFQCPYCHGWELQDRRWGYLARTAAAMDFALTLRCWTADVTVFTGGAFEVPPNLRRRFAAAQIRIETAPVARLVERDGSLESVALEGDAVVPCEVLFAHPPQRQIALVQSLGLALDEHGFVHVDAISRETSMPGVYAAGDLAGRMQWASIAAASAVRAAAMINHELTIELLVDGAFLAKER